MAEIGTARRKDISNLSPSSNGITEYKTKITSAQNKRPKIFFERLSKDEIQ